MQGGRERGAFAAGFVLSRGLKVNDTSNKYLDKYITLRIKYKTYPNTNSECYFLLKLYEIYFILIKNIKKLQHNLFISSSGLVLAEMITINITKKVLQITLR